MFGFIHKLDLKVQDFSESEMVCAQISGTFDSGIIDKKKEDNKYNAELKEALQNPKLLPPSNNIDNAECDYKTMFKSDSDRDQFYLMFKQQCIFKNGCNIDIEDMPVDFSMSEKFKSFGGQ